MAGAQLGSPASNPARGWLDERRKGFKEIVDRVPACLTLAKRRNEDLGIC